SLFSHLPDRLFRAWIKRLLECLTPNGILCLSTHDQCLLAPGTAMPDYGIVYLPSSENADLDTDVYGTTFVSREYVERAIAEASDGLAKSTRLGRALAHEQDIYVVTPSDARDHKAFDAFRRGPWGWVDSAEINEHGM